jgi:hypothetical protein
MKNKLKKLISPVWVTAVLLSFVFMIFTAPLKIGAESATSSGVTETSSGDYYLQNGLGPGIIKTGLCIFAGCPSGGSTANGLYPTDPNAGNNQGGATRALAGFMNTMYQQQPASAVVYAQDQYNKVITGQSLFAQAADPADPNNSDAYINQTGQYILQPLIGIWQWSRNIVYGLFVLILILLSFLIILRRPMGGQELITLENSLPSVIISLVLVTFSYAICGLFIDGVYLGCNVVYNFMIKDDNAPGHGLETVMYPRVDDSGRYIQGDQVELPNVLQPDDPQMSVWTIFNTTEKRICLMDTADELTPECAISKYIMPKVVTSNGVLIVINRIMGVMQDIFQSDIGNLFLELLIQLLIFQVGFKIFMLLLNDYLTLSLYPIIAPWVFLTAALPSRTNQTINNFIKTLGSAALDFIVVYALFLFLIIIGQTSVGSQNQISAAYSQIGQLRWTPPLLGYSKDQIYGLTTVANGGNNIISTLLIFGIFTGVPTIVEMVKKMFELPELSAVGQIGKNLVGTAKQTAGIVGMGAQKIGGEFFGGK